MLSRHAQGYTSMTKECLHLMMRSPTHPYSVAQAQAPSLQSATSTQLDMAAPAFRTRAHAHTQISFKVYMMLRGRLLLGAGGGWKA